MISSLVVRTGEADVVPHGPIKAVLGNDDLLADGTQLQLLMS